jgi:hypothetical protein
VQTGLIGAVLGIGDRNPSNFLVLADDPSVPPIAIDCADGTNTFNFGARAAMEHVFTHKIAKGSAGDTACRDYLASSTGKTATKTLLKAMDLEKLLVQEPIRLSAAVRRREAIMQLLA